MTLKEKLGSISTCNLPKLNSGFCKDLDEFWEKFIYPLLPDKNVVLAWNKLLMDYVKEDEAVFSIRAFGSWSAKAVEKEKGDELRRGFLTIPGNADYKYFFTDNYFAAYFAQMAYDNFCPTLEEFKNIMKDRMFPARYGRCAKKETDIAAYNIKGNVVNIGTAGYKIAHIFDAGKRFYIDGKESNITELSNKLCFPRGRYSDWKYDECEGVYVRRLDVKDLTKQVLAAHFLRTVNPINYFLVPKQRNTFKDKNGVKNTVIYHEYDNQINGQKCYDIAEYAPLQKYVSEKFSQIYGKDYQEYKKQIALPEDYFDDICKACISNEINIQYGNPLKGDLASKVSKKASNQSSKRKSKYDYELQLTCAKYFMEKKYSLLQIEREILKTPTNRNGCTAKMILDRLGIVSDKKGVLIDKDIHKELETAQGVYAKTLHDMIVLFNL